MNINGTTNLRKTSRFLLLLWITLFVAAGCSGNNDGQLTDPGPAECHQRVLVEVWGDTNGNGSLDEGEPPLAGALLGIMPKDDPSGPGIQLTTRENGRAHFPTRELDDCRPQGYQLLFLRQVPGYAFPADPVVDLAAFDPLHDAVQFGLQPE